MTDTLSIALCQIAPQVGDIDGNVARILKARDEAAAEHAGDGSRIDLLSGSEAERLLSKPGFDAFWEKTRPSLITFLESMWATEKRYSQLPTPEAVSEAPSTAHAGRAAAEADGPATGVSGAATTGVRASATPSVIGENRAEVVKFASERPALAKADKPERPAPETKAPPTAVPFDRSAPPAEASPADRPPTGGPTTSPLM